MPARSLATGTISFGLVAIPIRLYATGETQRSVSLNWLHAECGTRLRQQYVCPKHDAVVDKEERVKGYEFAKGQFVLFSEEELAALYVEPTHSVDISEFVPAATVDPVYFDRSYYLGPNKGGERPYRLLAAAMRATGRVALARYAARGRTHLVLLRPYQDGLVMQQLRFADEVRSFDEVPREEGEVGEQELTLARQLVEQIASDTFRPEDYHDEVRERMLEMIERKVEGQEITAAPAEQPKAQIIDLMAALKASLGSGQESSGGAEPERRAGAVEG